MTASKPDPQSRFTVTAGVSIGRPGAEADVAREVGGVGRGLEDVAEDDVPDGGGVDAGPVEGGPAADDAEVGSGEVLEGAAEGAEAGAHAGEEDDARLAWGRHDARKYTV